MAEQLQFPFPSLDFPGRTTLTAGEIAERLGYDEKHVRDLITEGELPALDGKGRAARRGSYRVPIENYRDFITSRMTGSRRIELLRDLPKPVLRELIRELNEFSKT
jgi:excisionase family DNA binding protein